MMEPTRKEWADWASTIEQKPKQDFYYFISLMAGLSPTDAMESALARQRQLMAFPLGLQQQLEASRSPLSRSLGNLIGGLGGSVSQGLQI